MDMEIKGKNSKKLKNGGKRIDCNGWMMFENDVAKSIWKLGWEIGSRNIYFYACILFLL